MRICSKRGEEEIYTETLMWKILELCEQDLFLSDPEMKYSSKRRSQAKLPTHSRNQDKSGSHTSSGWGMGVFL